MKLSGGLVVLAVLAAGLLVARLSMGPIPLEGIGDQIASALHQRFGRDLQFKLGSTSIVTQGFGPSLDIDRLSVAGPDGVAILEAPKAKISVDPFALLIGKVVPKRLEVFDVTLRLVKLKSGSLAVAAGDGSKPLFVLGGSETPAAGAPAEASATTASPTAAAPTAPPRRAASMREAAQAIRQLLDMLTDPRSAIAAVDRLGIERGTLVIQDQETNTETSYKNLDLAFDRHNGQTSFDLSAEGPSHRWTIDAVASGRPGAARHFAMKAQNLSIDELELAMGSRSIGFDSDMPFGAHVDIGLKADDTLSEATGGFDLGPGFLRIDDPDQEPYLVTSIDGAFRWKPSDRTIEVTTLHYLDEEGSHFTGAGSIHPPVDEGQPWTISLAMSEPGLLAPDRKGQLPLPITDGTFAGRLLMDQKRFAIDRLSFKSGAGGGFAALGDVDWINGPRIRFGASLDPVPVAVVKRIWPAFIAAPPRAWLLSHFEAGTIRNGTLKIDYVGNDLKRMRADRAPSNSSVSLTFDVADGRVVYLDGVPPVDKVEGTVRITGRTSDMQVASGTIDANGKPINLTDGSFTIANANVHPIEAHIGAHLSGSVEAVATILSLPALKPYASLPFDPSTVHGKVDGLLQKTLFLGTEDNARDVLKIDARVSDFVAENMLGKENLEDATIDVAVDAGKLKATGRGKIFDAPATFEIDRAGFGTPTAAVTLTLDEAARAKLGLSSIQGLTGPIVARINTALGDPSKIKAQVDIDLTKASISAAYLGLTKPAGRPGKVAFTLASGPTRMMIDQISADIGPFQARGAVDLGADNSFQSAHFSSFKVSSGDDMKLDVTKSDESFKMTIRGTTIDARPFLKALTTTPTNGTSALARSAKAEKQEANSFKGFDIDLKSAILTGNNKEVMSGVDLKLSKRGPTIRALNFQGRFGQQAVSANMGANQTIKISTTDAGALVSFIDLYKHMEGGLLLANLQLDGDQLQGNLEMHNFILRDEPAIRRLVAQSAEVSAPGADADAARKIDAGAVRFNRLKVNFKRDGSQLELRDANMSGPEIGLSVEGWLDYSHDRVDMKGTFVPAFALNNLFSQIPVLGVFLGGKSSEGLLAITFRITGSASTPTLSINPLSVVTPGILRNIFGALDDAAFRPGGGPQYTEPSR